MSPTSFPSRTGSCTAVQLQVVLELRTVVGIDLHPSNLHEARDHVVCLASWLTFGVSRVLPTLQMVFKWLLADHCPWTYCPACMRCHMFVGMAARSSCWGFFISDQQGHLCSAHAWHPYHIQRSRILQQGWLCMESCEFHLAWDMLDRVVGMDIRWQMIST